MTADNSTSDQIPEELSRRLNLVNRLLELRSEDAELFDTVISDDLSQAIECDDRRRAVYREYCSGLTEDWRDHDPAAQSELGRRGRPKKWYPRLVEEVWIRASFLNWRDQCGIRPACDKLIYRGLGVTVYDTPDGEFQPITFEADGDYCDLPEPPRLRVELDANDTDHNLARVYYNEFPKLDSMRRARAEYQLKQYKRAYRGESSIYTREMINLIFPPRRV